MTGLIYKELKQNKVYIVATMLIPFFVYIAAFGILIVDKGFSDSLSYMNEERGQITLLLLAVVGMFVGGGLQIKTYEGDESKKWASFVTASSEGVKGYIYTKYMLIFGMSLLYVFSLSVVHSIAGTLYYLCVGEPFYSSVPSVVVILFYVQILLRAIDMIFIIRFGTKVGEIIKMCLMIFFAIGGILLLNAFPKEMFALIDMVKGIFNSESDKEVILLSGVQPFVFVGFYIASYYISCKLYLKGVKYYGK